eukprot:1206363-Prymnesium_polylepis.1
MSPLRLVVDSLKRVALDGDLRRWPDSESDTARCPSEYFSRTYPARHREWRAQGRLLFFCSESSGLGAYFNSVSSGLAASVLTERALILSCGSSKWRNAAKEEGYAASFALAHHLAHYFNGRGFDWHPEGLVLPTSPVELHVSPSGCAPCAPARP